MKRLFNRILDYGHRAGVVALSFVMVFTMSVALAGCNQQADIAKVLAVLPTVEGIVNSVGSIVAGADPVIAVPVDAALATVDASFAVVEGILKTYQSNINAAPQSVIATLDAAIAAIQANLTTIQGLIPGLSAVIIAGISVGLTALESILSLVASLLPPSVASSLFPKSFKVLSGAKIVFGTHVAIPSPRSIAKDYNARIDAAGFKSNKKAHLHVPWIHLMSVPVLP
jgi:hypothetical protein